MFFFVGNNNFSLHIWLSRVLTRRMLSKLTLSKIPASQLLHSFVYDSFLFRQGQIKRGMMGQYTLEANTYSRKSKLDIWITTCPFFTNRISDVSFKAADKENVSLLFVLLTGKLTLRKRGGMGGSGAQLPKYQGGRGALFLGGLGSLTPRTP